MLMGISTLICGTMDHYDQTSCASKLTKNINVQIIRCLGIRRAVICPQGECAWVMFTLRVYIPSRNSEVGQEIRIYARIDGYVSCLFITLSFIIIGL